MAQILSTEFRNSSARESSLQTDRQTHTYIVYAHKCTSREGVVVIHLAMHIKEGADLHHKEIPER